MYIKREVPTVLSILPTVSSIALCMCGDEVITTASWFLPKEVQPLSFLMCVIVDTS